MANVVITSDSERIYFVFNDYSDQAGMSSGNWAKFDISCELNNGDTDLFVFDDGNNLFRLSYNVYSPALLVDSVDGVAPTSNSDLKTKIDAILSAGGGGSAWGTITGTLSSQTDLQSALDAKQTSDADLTTIAALNSATSGVIASDGAGWISKTYAELKTALGLVKANVGLGNVDNTSDADKPISTATQSALDAKQPLDTQLTSLAGLSYGSNALKVVRVNAGETDFELASPSAGSLTITSIEQSLGSTPTWRGKFTVVDASISASSNIQIWQRFAALTGKGTLADENEMDYIDCHAEAGSGQFTVYWQTKPQYVTSRIEKEGNTVRSGVSTFTPYADQFMYQTKRIGKVKGNFKFNYIYS
jgi:hypothetical protein